MPAELKATRRSDTGTRKARALRKGGLIPAVIYGHGKECLSITLNEHEVKLAIQHGERLLEIDLDGRKEHTLIKEVQYDTFGHVVLHVDLTRVTLDQRVEVTVPIVLRGTPAGAADGGVLQLSASEVRVECLVTDIPEEIRLQVNELNIGDALHMSDLPLPAGSTLLDEPEATVCTVIVIAEEVEVPEEEAAEAPAEPEVIGEKKEEEGEQGEGEQAQDAPA